MQHNRSSLPNFHYIDTVEGLKYLNNNHELYIKILNNFFLRYKDLNFLTLSEKEAKDTIHTIKGLSATLGMHSLSKISELLHRGEDGSPEEFQIELNYVIKDLDNQLKSSKMEIKLKTILILNDNEKDIDNLLNILDKNYDILVVLDLSEVDEILEIEQIDLLLLSLDYSNTYELKKFQERLKMSDIPIILTTANYLKKKINQDIIVKSFDSLELLNKIQSIL